MFAMFVQKPKARDIQAIFVAEASAIASTTIPAKI
jgi:hypothetical protein